MAAYPNEGCGVLIGSINNENVEVVDVLVGHNLWTERSRDRYDLDPADILAAEKSGRDRALDVVGFWHSHPDHPAQPSQFDADRAWVDYVYLICATVTQGSRDLNAFMITAENEGFTQVAMEVMEVVTS